VYLTLLCFIMIYSMRLAAYYETIELSPKDQIMNDYRAMKSQRDSMWCCTSWVRVCFRYSWENVRFRWQYTRLCQLFIAQNVTFTVGPSTYRINEHFRFYIYLRKCIRETALYIAGIHWYIWLAIMVLVLGVAVSVKYIDYHKPTGELWFMAMVVTRKCTCWKILTLRTVTAAVTMLMATMTTVMTLTTAMRILTPPLPAPSRSARRRAETTTTLPLLTAKAMAVVTATVTAIPKVSLICRNRLVPSPVATSAARSYSRPRPSSVHCSC